MIILIMGATHTGKTRLAQQLLEKYKFPYLSIDHLKMGLIRSGNTSLTPEDDNELQKILWPIVREIIKTAIENNQNLIVEGISERDRLSVPGYVKRIYRPPLHGYSEIRECHRKAFARHHAHQRRTDTREQRIFGAMPQTRIRLHFNRQNLS